MPSKILLYIFFLASVVSSQLYVLSTGTSEACVCKLVNTGLVSNCNDLQLTDIPACVPNNTLVLKLQQNDFKVIKPKAFQRFSYLRELYLGFNSLGKLDNGAFDGLANLVVLSLTKNYLGYNDSFAENVFTPLTGLKTLYLQGNCQGRPESSCSYPEHALVTAKSVENLHLDGLPNTDLGYGFSALTSLRKLVMSGPDLEYGSCNLPTLTVKTFSALRSTPVSTLYLYDCGIRKIEPGVFRQIWNLTTLTVVYNAKLCSDSLINITDGLNTTNLRTLQLNVFCNIPPYNIQLDRLTSQNLQNTSLEILDLSHNRIVYIEPSFVYYLPESMVAFYLRENIIADAHFLEHIVRLKNLKIFDGSYQNYYRESNELPFYRQSEVLAKVSQVQNIRRVTANASHLASEYTTDGRHTSTVDVLWTTKLKTHSYEITDWSISKRNQNNESYARAGNSENFAKQWQNYTSGDENDSIVALPRNIEVLLLNDIKLKYPVPMIRFGTNKLLYLDASRCMLTAMLGPLIGLDDLMVLNLAHNNLNMMHQLAFAFMANLTNLHLQGNRLGVHVTLGEKIFRNLKRLETLNLNSNYIQRLPKNIFTGLTKLIELHLADNSLTTIDFRLEELSSLTYLDLSRNQIKVIADVNLKFLDSLSKRLPLKVNLTGNILPCTCYSNHLVRWLSVTKVSILRANILQ